MQRFRFLFLTTFVTAALLAAPAAAQQGPGAGGPPQLPAGPGEIRGSAVDEAGGAIARASVAVRSRQDSALVAGALAGPDGTFRIQGLRPGRYIVRVTMLGFRPHVQEIAITPAEPRAALGAIRLARVAVALSGVEVTAEADAVTIEPDRNSYRSKDVAPAAANASDVLDGVPSVQVDGEGKVSYRGNENVAIQINGRPSPLRGAQLASYLKALPAAVVDKVEVVPNPSAKYDPEGMAGIINIVLKQNVDLGLSGGASVSAASARRFNGSGNLGWQAGKLTLFGSYGYNRDRRGVFGINDRERYEAINTLRSVTEEDVNDTARFRGHNVYGSADYKLNARDVFSSTMTFNLRGAGNAMASTFDELDGSRAVTSRYTRSRDGDISGWMGDAALRFQRTFDPKRKHDVIAELRYNQAADEDFVTLWRQPLTLSGAPNGGAIEGETNATDAVTRALTAQLDYTKTLAQRTKLESGYKGTARWLDREFVVMNDDAGTGTWTRSPTSNAFEFDEQVHAAYAVLSHGLGKWDLQAGLRAEWATRDFTLSDQAYPFDYGSLFPSAIALYNVNQFTQLKASYSRRIRRPGTQELSPFPHWFDAQTVFMGNPDIAPEYTDAYEFGYTRTFKLGNVQVAPFYRRTSNIIRMNIDTDAEFDGREVTMVRAENVATSNSWGADLNGTLRAGSKFSGLAGANVFKIVTDGGSNSVMTSDALAWMARVNGTTQLTKTFSVQAAYFYRAPMKIERGRFAAQQGTQLLIRQKVKGDAASVSLRIQDVFNTNGMKIRAGDDNLIQVTERNFGVRGAFLTFQYAFGQQPRIRQQPQEQQQPSGGFGP